MALGRLSKCFRTLVFEPQKGVFRIFLRPDWKKGRAEAKRYLLTEDVLRLQDFQQRKLALAHFATGSEGNFIELFNKKLQRDDLVLCTDLKLLLHLCQSPDDMVVARDAIYRYHSENPNFANGDFRFGPLFMRLCYELGQEEMAVATITDKRLNGFFNDSTSFNIAVDMLFTKGAYEKALEVLRTMQIVGVQFSKDTVILAFGICYKLNTPESYRICTALMEELQSKDRPIPRHAYCFAVTLALGQNDTDMAQSLYSEIMNTDSRICKNLKVLILAKSGALEEAISILSDAVLLETPSFIKKPQYIQEVVDVLLFQCKDGPHMTHMNQIVSQLEQAGQVIQQTLDDLLCHPPAAKHKQVLIMQNGSMTRRTTSRRTLYSTLLKNEVI